MEHLAGAAGHGADGEEAAAGVLDEGEVARRRQVAELHLGAPAASWAMIDGITARADWRGP